MTTSCSGGRSRYFY